MSDFLSVFLLAFALSMDAFAVSIALGSKDSNHQTPIKLALLSSCYFGIAQGVMPLIGYSIGLGFTFWLGSYLPWISFILLLFIGLKMIHESFQPGPSLKSKRITHRTLLILAIATSIDAMAAGVVLNEMSYEPLLACFIIGLTTACFSYFGVHFGNKSIQWIGSKAEFFGGVILIGIGVRILLPTLN